jgi:hypothetical protein
MDTRLEYRQVIKDVLLDYAALKPVYGDIESRVLFDDERDSYALLQVGWDRAQYVHGTVIHLELIGGKVWIQCDGTEEGVARELVDAGIPKEHIVLGFRPEQVRAYTEYAVR